MTRAARTELAVSTPESASPNREVRHVRPDRRPFPATPAPKPSPKRERSRRSEPTVIDRPPSRKAVVAERRALKAGPPPGPPLRRTRGDRKPAAVHMAPPSYYALVVQGIEDLAAAELTAAGAHVSARLTGFDKRDGIIVYDGVEPARAMRCGLLEDVYQVVADLPTPEGPKGAKLLASALERTQFERAMTARHALRPKSAKRSFKVVTRVAGKQAFNRHELEHHFITAVSSLLPRWSPSADRAAIEIWVHVVRTRTIVGMRLSGDELAQRRYKHAHLPASLKPTVARALVALADPQREDIMLDAMCGAGTILRERAEAMRAALILGGDIGNEAIAAAIVNAGKQAALARWDATNLPLRDASVDSVITNPPYGRQHEAAPGLGRLYGRMMREVARVLRPGGRAVVLTGEPDALARAVPSAMRTLSTRRLLVRGLTVVAFVIERQ